jgi:hypothetical protein
MVRCPQPAADSLQEAQILLAEEVSLWGLRRKRPTAGIVYVHRGDHLGADAKALFHADQLARHPLHDHPRGVRRVGKPHRPPTVCNRLAIKADGALVPAHWPWARPNCNQSGQHSNSLFAFPRSPRLSNSCAGHAVHSSSVVQPEADAVKSSQPTLRAHTTSTR